MEEYNVEKSDLRKRMDDLQSELHHITLTKYDKEEKLRNQISQNE